MKHAYMRRPWTFTCNSRLSIASVDDKQHLSMVLFSALVGFSLYTTSTHHRVKQSPKSTTGISSVTYMILCGARDRSCGQKAIGASFTTISSTFLALDLDFWRETRLLWFPRLPATSDSPVMPFFPRPKIGYFSNNESPTKALNTIHSNAACHQLTLLTGGKQFTHAYECSRSPHASVFHWNPLAFQKKIRSYTFLTDLVLQTSLGEYINSTYLALFLRLWYNFSRNCVSFP